jgi:hypothetical protein
MFIYHRNVSVSIVPIIRKGNNDALTNNIYSFFLKYIQMKYIQTDRHTFAFIYKMTVKQTPFLFCKAVCIFILVGWLTNRWR